MTAVRVHHYGRRWSFLLLALALLSGSLAACGGEPTFRAEPAFDGRVYDLPVDLLALPEGGYLLAEQDGRVTRLAEDGARQDIVVDLTAEVARGHEELGLLAIALDPSFAETGWLWVHYIADEPLRNVIARHDLGGGETSKPVLALEVPQPYENHNGGAMRFGPDGMLYVGIGDGGGAWDPEGNGQNVTTLLSSILRIDVTDAGQDQAYAIPEDNPFAGRLVSGPEARAEVWAYGFRNPWRFDFDPETGDLWVGDVGQDHFEEVDLVRRGGNYGWSLMEGAHCRVDSCEGVTTVQPVTAYTHAEGCAVTGGVVVRDGGPLDGDFVYGDLCSGTIWAVADGEEPRVLTQVEGPIVAFAEDRDGGVLVLRFGAPVLRIVVD